jgi:hypothetical protein
MDEASDERDVEGRDVLAEAALRYQIQLVVCETSIIAK